MFTRVVVSEVTFMLYIQNELPLHTTMRAILITGFLLSFPIAGWLMAQEADTTFQAAEELLKAQDYEGARTLYHQFRKRHPDFDPGETDVHFGLGESLFRLGQYDSALFYFKATLTEKRQSPRPAGSQLLVHGRLGYIYRYIKFNYRKALSQFESERQLLEEHDSLVEVRVNFANSYNLATTYRLLENYERALNYAFSSLSIIQNEAESNQRSLLLSYSVIANILGDMEEFKRATEYHLKKIRLSEELYGALQPEMADYYNNAALDFLGAREYDEALRYFLKTQKSVQNPEENKYLLSVSHRSISTIYQLKKDYNKTKKHLDTALTYSSGNAFEMASTIRNLGSYFEELDLYDSAILMYQQALGHAISDFKWESLAENPSEDQLFSDPFYYRLLKEKAQCWLNKYKFDGDLSALSEANKGYKLMDRLTQAYRDNFTMESSKLFFQSWNYSNYESAVNTLYELHKTSQEDHYIGEAWHHIEMNKSVLLLENLMRAEKADLAGITDSLKTSVSQASELIWNTRRDLTDCQQNEDCAESKVIQLRTDLRLAEAELEAYRKAIQKESPDYYQLAYDKDLISLSKVQESIEGDAVVLNYFATDSDYYLIGVSKEKSYFQKVTRDSSLDQALTDFLKEVSGETLQNQDLKTGYRKYTQSGALLLERLLPQEIREEKHQKLVIIPDGLLSLLPFEALTLPVPSGSNVNFSDLPYLIRSHQINYGYSATLWFKNQQNPSLDKNAQLLGFGVPSVSNSNFSDLPGTLQESESLKVLANARVYTDNNTGETTFKEKSAEADIIHLALHNANDIKNPLNSQLIFNQNSAEDDGSLYLYELYGLQMKAGLVVLSACATGVGDWQKGEGAYHMGRGFLYHGNPAIIISLWKVRDATAARLMQGLYEDLSEGIDSDEALRNTKLRYLEQSDEITAHPSNWASFVGIGKTRIRKDHTLLYVFILIGVLSVGFVFRQLRVGKPRTT